MQYWCKEPYLNGPAEDATSESRLASHALFTVWHWQVLNKAMHDTFFIVSLLHVSDIPDNEWMAVL